MDRFIPRVAGRPLNRLALERVKLSSNTSDDAQIDFYGILVRPRVGCDDQGGRGTPAGAVSRRRTNASRTGGEAVWGLFATRPAPWGLEGLVCAGIGRGWRFRKRLSKYYRSGVSEPPVIPLKGRKRDANGGQRRSSIFFEMSRNGPGHSADHITASGES